MLVGNREALSTFGTPTSEHMASIFRAHANQESVSFSTAVLVGLKRPFHEYAFKALFFRPSIERTFNTSDPVAALSITGMCRQSTVVTPKWSVS